MNLVINAALAVVEKLDEVYDVAEQVVGGAEHVADVTLTLAFGIASENARLWMRLFSWAIPDVKMPAVDVWGWDGEVYLDA